MTYELFLFAALHLIAAGFVFLKNFCLLERTFREDKYLFQNFITEIIIKCSFY